MQAVILAAGLGSRLGDIKKNLPKGFLYIESLHETLIERSLRLLKEAGIQEVIIGTGYENKAYNALADRLSAKDFKIITHKNEKFATTGSAYTLWCLREFIAQDFLLLESDLVYEPLAIKALLQDERKDLVLASGATQSGDEVYMSIVQDKLQDLSKDKTKLDSIDGELVGISKISLQSFAKLDCHSQNDYEYLLKGFDVLKIDNLIWCEIDCLEHLERAKKLIIPKILKKDSQ